MKKLLFILLTFMLMLSNLTGCTTPVEKEESYTFADTIAWDAEYDVVVAGFGAAGAVASKYASEAGAEVLLIEKVDQGHEGGNSKVCAQYMAYGHDNAEGTMKYYESLYKYADVDKDMLNVLVDGIANSKTTLMNDFGISEGNFIDYKGKSLMAPEYPEFDVDDTVSTIKVAENGVASSMYAVFQNEVFNKCDGIDIWYSSPAVELIQDPTTKTIVGIKVEREGNTLNVRALNGVVLATGGFEANEEMVENYLGLHTYAAMGSQTNTGDGVKMAQEIGADLWHMEVFESGFNNLSLSLDLGIGTPAINFPKGVGWSQALKGAAVTVGDGGQRYFREDLFMRHGHTSNNDSWKLPKFPNNTYLVCTKEYYDNILENENMIGDYEKVYQANTIEELAKMINVNVDGLTTTINNFNEYALEGFDPEFGRLPENMKSFENGPYVAVYLVPVVLNTQGGPKRNAEAEVLDIHGKAIPNLYSAGELGGMTADMYQGGTNLAECMIYGKIAGENAAKEKESLPTYTPLDKVESTPTKLGEISDYDANAEFSVELGEDEYLGVGQGLGGDLYAKVKIVDSEIISIDIVKNNDTVGVCEEAINVIPQAIIDAQSTEVDVVTSVTYTSKGIIEAVNDAIAQSK